MPKVKSGLNLHETRRDSRVSGFNGDFSRIEPTGGMLREDVELLVSKMLI